MNQSAEIQIYFNNGDKVNQTCILHIVVFAVCKAVMNELIAAEHPHRCKRE